jgi:hypothetical protein
VRNVVLTILFQWKWIKKKTNLFNDFFLFLNFKKTKREKEENTFCFKSLIEKKNSWPLYRLETPFYYPSMKKRFVIFFVRGYICFSQIWYHQNTNNNQLINYLFFLLREYFFIFLFRLVKFEKVQIIDH